MIRLLASLGLPLPLAAALAAADIDIPGVWLVIAGAVVAWLCLSLTLTACIALYVYFTQPAEPGGRR